MTLISHKLNEGTERHFYVNSEGVVVSPYFETKEEAEAWYTEKK